MMIDENSEEMKKARARTAAREAILDQVETKVLDFFSTLDMNASLNAAERLCESAYLVMDKIDAGHSLTDEEVVLLWAWMGMDVVGNRLVERFQTPKDDQ